MRRKNSSIKRTILKTDKITQTENNSRVRYSKQSQIEEGNRRKKLNARRQPNLNVSLIPDREQLRLFGRIHESYKSFKNGNYQKEEDVDYDCIVMISTFNRYEKVKKIIDTLLNQKSDYTIRIVLLNDGSTDKNYENFNSYDIDYLQNEENLGKFGYWKSFNKLISKANTYKSHCVIQIDDDFELPINFVNRLTTLFFEKKEENNRYVALYYHNASYENRDNFRWGIEGNWLDGGSLFDSNFLKEFNALQPIKFVHNLKFVSSGVWKQISKVINGAGCLVYHTEKSYAKHVGNLDSKMNIDRRLDNPINTVNFIDEE